MENITIITSVISLAVSCVSLIKVITGWSASITKFNCNLENLTQKLDETVCELKVQRREIEDLKIQVAKITK